MKTLNAELRELEKFFGADREINGNPGVQMSSLAADMKLLAEKTSQWLAIQNNH